MRPPARMDALHTARLQAKLRADGPSIVGGVAELEARLAEHSDGWTESMATTEAIAKQRSAKLSQSAMENKNFLTQLLGADDGHNPHNIQCARHNKRTECQSVEISGTTGAQPAPKQPKSAPENRRRYPNESPPVKPPARRTHVPTPTRAAAPTAPIGVLPAAGERRGRV